MLFSFSNTFQNSVTAFAKSKVQNNGFWYAYEHVHEHIPDFGMYMNMLIVNIMYIFGTCVWRVVADSLFLQVLYKPQEAHFQ
jgi:hypothetical protein